MDEREMNTQSDEIALIDILRVLVKYYRLIVVGTLLMTLVGVGVATQLPSKYEYATMIQIGKTVTQGDKSVQAVLIEKPETLIAKIKGVYIPLAQQQSLDSTSGTLLPHISIDNPKKSDLIRLVSNACESDRQSVLQIHQMTVDLIYADCSELMKRQLLPLESSIARAQLQLNRLQNPLLKSIRDKKSQGEVSNALSAVSRLKGTSEILQTRLSSVDEKKTFLEVQLTEVQTALKRASEIRLEAVTSTDSNSRTMTLLMLERQIEQDRGRLVDMQNQLLFELDENKKKLEQQISENLRQQEQQLNRIETIKNTLLNDVADAEYQQLLIHQQILELQARLDLTEETRAVAVAVASLGPVSPKKPLIVVLAFLFGLMTTIIASFIFDYFKKNKVA